MVINKGFIRKLVSKLFLLIIGLILLCIVFYQSVNFEFFGELYSKDEIANFKNEQASVVYSEDGKIIGKYYSKNRTNIKEEDIPPHLINALVATEDARYFEHEGVDSRSVLRVIFKSILLRDKSAGGGSTITQQLAKNMYGRKRFGLLTIPVNKCKEIILAGRIEALYNKQEILTLYLNTVPFGENVYGIQAAAKRYFNRDVNSLKIEESALLIGMLKANSYYNPRLHPKNSLSRRNTVLNQLYQYEYIEDWELDSLQNLPLQLDYANLKSGGVANYFMVQCKNEAVQIIEELNRSQNENYDIQKDGLIIQSTLNYGLQEHAKVSFSEHLTSMQKLLRAQLKKEGGNSDFHQLVRRKYDKLNPEKDSIHPVELFSWDGFYRDSITSKDSLIHALSLLHAGLVALDPSSGAVKTWVGGIDFRTQPYDQILAKRQMASTFKPILYAAALESGIAPCEYLDNSSFSLSDFESWSPHNYDQKEGGKYSLAAALAFSKNIPTVHLFFKLGFESLDYLWKKIGFSSALENKPSVALGTTTASLLESALAYSMFANGGYAVKPFFVKSISTASGKVIYSTENNKGKALIQEETAKKMNTILQKAILNGTGTAIIQKYQVKIPLAGKTGTAQSFSDAWFVAYNPNIVIATRVGANSPSVHFNSGSNGSGGRLALPLVGLTLSKAQEEEKLYSWLSQPFPELNEEQLALFDCQDFRPESKVSKFFNQFKKKETTLEKQQKKAKRVKLFP